MRRIEQKREINDTMSFQSASALSKVACLLSVAAITFTCVAIFTPCWMVSSLTDTALGLFFICNNGYCTDHVGGKTQTWQIALAVLEIIGGLCAALSFIFTVLYIFIPATSGRKWVKMAALLLALAAGLFILTGAILCSEKKSDFPEYIPGIRPTFDLGWSFALAIVGGLLHLTTGIIFALDGVL